MVKKIALFTPIIKSKGGKERAELTLLEHSKHKIDLFTFDYEKERTFPEFQKYKVVDLKHHRYSSMSFIQRGFYQLFDTLMTKIDLSEYDVLLISTAGISELFALRNHAKTNVALTHTQFRIVHEFYDYYKNKNLLYRVAIPIFAFFYKRLEKRAWKKIDYAIVYSEEVRNRFQKHGTFDVNKVFKISPSVEYPNKPSSKHEKFFLYNSRFTPYKRQELAIEAFKRSGLQKEGYKLVLTGFIENKNYFDRLKKTAGRYIIFRPNLSEKEIKEHYRRCYATLFTAINEDTGLVPIESLAYGKPVITVNEGGPKEFIINGYNGIVVKADPTAIAQAMVRLTDKKLYDVLSYGARHSPKYTTENAVKEFDRIIDIVG